MAGFFLYTNEHELVRMDANSADGMDTLLSGEKIICLSKCTYSLVLEDLKETGAWLYSD